MTESEWVNATDPHEMLNWLYRAAPISERKARLFACACVRRVWDLLGDDRCRELVRVAEWVTEGELGQDELRKADAALDVAAQDCEMSLPRLDAQVIFLRPDALQPARRAAQYRAAGNAAWTQGTLAGACARLASRYSVWLAAWGTESAELPAPASAVSARLQAERLAQAGILRDLIGPIPVRPVHLDRTWLESGNRLVMSLAGSIYENQDFSAMPVLADALEDSDCTYTDFLDHCRGPGPHARGCWVVDLLLGKE